MNSRIFVIWNILGFYILEFFWNYIFQIWTPRNLGVWQQQFSKPWVNLKLNKDNFETFNLNILAQWTQWFPIKEIMQSVNKLIHKNPSIKGICWIETHVFHGVDRTWNSAWNKKPQHSISLLIHSDCVNMATAVTNTNNKITRYL